MKKRKFYTHEEMHKDWMKDPRYREAYDDLEAEFQIARQMIDARLKRKMSQEELARRAKTGQAVISRLEGMNARPSISLLQRVARALNTKFNITIQ